MGDNIRQGSRGKQQSQGQQHSSQEQEGGTEEGITISLTAGEGVEANGTQSSAQSQARFGSNKSGSDPDVEKVVKGVVAGITRAAELGALGIGKMPEFDVDSVKADLQAQSNGLRVEYLNLNNENTARVNDLAATLAKIARQHGFHEQANRYENSQGPQTLGEKFGATMNRAVTVKHAGIFLVGSLVALVVWEGIAYKMDWKRFGMFGPKPGTAPADAPKVTVQPRR